MLGLGGYSESSNGIDWEVVFRKGSDFECEGADAVAHGNGRWFLVDPDTLFESYICAKTTEPRIWRIFLRIDGTYQDLLYANGDWIALEKRGQFGTW